MKVVGPFDDLEEFTEEDVALQEKFVFEKTAKKIKERVMKMGITDERLIFIVLSTYVCIKGSRASQIVTHTNKEDVSNSWVFVLSINMYGGSHWGLGVMQD